MPIVFRCSDCGRDSQVPGDYAGRWVKCRCGARHLVEVPAREDRLLLDDRRPLRKAPRHSAASTPAIVEEEPTPKAWTVPPEPWYYWLVDVTARCAAAAFVGLFVLSLLLGTYIESATEGRIPIAALIVPSFLGLVLSLLALAPVLLAVDVARNIRALRYGQR